MNDLRDDIIPGQLLSLKETATNDMAVCTGATSSDTLDLVRLEMCRFLTDGQRVSGNCHNAILMRNKNHIQFPSKQISFVSLHCEPLHI